MQNQRWALDFVNDALANERKLPLFAIIDLLMRESLRIVTEMERSLLRIWY
jgi:hypothetical protein